MRRKRRIPQGNTQRYPLQEHIDRHQPLVELASQIDLAATPVHHSSYATVANPTASLDTKLLRVQHTFNLFDYQLLRDKLGFAGTPIREK
jgi:hypothetical protein